jgi:uncharacterized protein YqkB
MKKLLIFFLMLFLISCDKATTTLETTYETTTNPTTNTTSGLTTTTTIYYTSWTVPITTVTTAIETTSEASLKTEVLPIYSSYYGNTNGNANNMGLVLFDTINQLHIYAVGSNVYTYDQMLDETNLLFSLNDGGYVRNMCITEEYLYFVSSLDQWMMKFDLTTEAITTISEAETYFISRYDNYIYVDMVDPTYSVRGMKVFSDSSQSFLSTFSGGVENLNISGTKVFYNQVDGTNIQVAGSTFSGKTTEANLSEYEFEEIEEIHLIKDSYSTGRTYAFIASTTSETALYLYNANTGLEKLLNGSDLHSLNSDTYNLYYMNQGAIYKYNLDSKETSKIVNVDTNSRYIYVVNYWVYYSNDTLSALYRIDPDTLEVETLS